MVIKAGGITGNRYEKSYTFNDNSSSSSTIIYIQNNKEDMMQISVCIILLTLAILVIIGTLYFMFPEYFAKKRKRNRKKEFADKVHSFSFEIKDKHITLIRKKYRSTVIKFGNQRDSQLIDKLERLPFAEALWLANRFKKEHKFSYVLKRDDLNIEI